MPKVRLSALVLVLTFAGSVRAESVPAPPPAPAPAPERRMTLELTTLNLMHEKHLINQAEYDSAMRDLVDSLGGKAGDALSLMLSKWSLTFYGFVEADFIYDTTQSFNEVAGNTAVARHESYAGTHGRFMVGVRDSRFGFRIRAPQYHGIRASANLEFDGLGNQPTTATEGQTWTNPAIRVRQYNLKIETPFVDFLVGQSWSLFGWQSLYFPNTVEIMGIPAELFHRDIQFRVSKTVRTAPVNVEMAVALQRPPQRDSGVPEGQGGIRLVLNKWTGMQTINSTGTSIAPLSIGLSGTVRGFRLTEFAAAPKSSNKKTGWGVAASGFIPIIPATAKKKGNSLSVSGEYVYGYGIADQFTSLTGGAVNADLPNAAGATPAPTYSANLDPGLVVYSPDGVAHLMQWQTFNAGIQYYLPKLDGRMWVSANVSRSNSDNARLHGAATKTRDSELWVDANIFGDIIPAVRVGLEYAWFNDHYVDGAHAINHRVQFAAYYLF